MAVTTNTIQCFFDLLTNANTPTQKLVRHYSILVTFVRVYISFWQNKMSRSIFHEKSMLLANLVGWLTPHYESCLFELVNLISFVGLSKSDCFFHGSQCFIGYFIGFLCTIC